MPTIPSPLLAVVSPVGAETAGTGDPAAALALLLYVLLALLVSFLCSIAEAVLLSLTPPYIEGLAEIRPGRARLLHRLKVEKLDRSLAAILTLNTIAHTVGAIGAGAKAVEVFGNTYFGVFSAAMTLAILFLSEIVPKTIGAVYWRSLTGFTAWFVQVLIWLLYPLLRISELMTWLIARGKKAQVFSRDELAAMANLGERSGALRPDESRIIRNLLLFENLTAGNIMTPRPVMVVLPEGMTVAEAMATAGVRPFTRLPVYRETIDQITGFVLKEDLLRQQLLGREDLTLAELKRDIPTVHENLRLRRLLDIMLEQRQAHIAVVIDEYGGTEGLVTMEDVVETLLGLEIVDEMDENVDMQAYARRRWRTRARAMGLAVDDDPGPDSAEN
ncbi:hemolysin family protein [bacterium]|nr:hemolysin family protein [bacterium]